MNISSFLLPTEQVAYITSTISMLEATEHLEHHHYTAIPIIDHEGDLLWKIKNTPGLNFENMQHVPLLEVQMRFHLECVSINARMDDMLTLAADQNFVPVTDDEGIFLGIIRRKDIIEYYTRNITD